MEIDMPSQRKQINVRIDDETASRLDRVQAAVSESLGLKVSVSDVFRLGVLELEKKYAPTPPAPKKKGKA